RQPRAGAHGARAGGAVGPRFRHPRRRARGGEARAAAPHRAGAGAADRGPGRRPGAARAAGPGGRAAQVSAVPANARPVRRCFLPRPAPALVACAVAWSLLGVATSIGWLPAQAWAIAGFALAAL